ncbi:hypothetical protein Plec18167_005217 [Paecilomyces lecythidis]|uniref:Uncharacterized protein n=1 Tax=Paecilomyces lecythidis TaxID=3004212 RepID=A0ABR3XMU1_9EURO
MTFQTQHKKIPVALVGGGTIAPLHAEYICSSPTCSLSAVIDPFDTGQKLAAKLSVPHFDSVQSLLSSDSQAPVAYIICAPSSLHVKLAVDVITCGNPKAVLIEKPFCTNSNSGSQLIELAKSKACQILVGHHRRFHPSLSAARNAIDDGKLGQITAIAGTWTAKKTDEYYSLADWRSSRSAGGGPVWTNFVHDVDVLHYLIGSRINRVWATPTIRRRETLAVPPSDLVEEGVAIMLRFENGVVGTFLVSDNVASPFGWEAATGDNPLYPPSPVAVDSYRIFGTNGTLTEPDGMLWTYEAAEAKKFGLEVGWNIPIRREVLQVGDEIPFQQQVEHLVRVATQDEKPKCSGEDGLAAVRVCEAVTSALVASDGIPVDIPV